MEASEQVLSSHLLSLLKNGQWEKDAVIKLFEALITQFAGRKEDFHTWMMKILHQVEIHKMSASDLTSNGDEIVNLVEKKIDDIAKNTEEKTLDEILKEICEQEDIDEEMMAQVTDIVSAVYHSLSTSTAPHLQGITQTLFKLCEAVEKSMKYKPRVTQMVSWCILVLSKSSRLVQVLTGEGKSCIVAMFAAHQVLNGKTPDIISSSPVLAERDAKQWFDFYKELDITVECNINKSESELKMCYDCQVVYGTTHSFAADWLKQHFLREDVRSKRKFHCVIVDEVDSLMLDKGLEVVYLSTEIPKMECLNGVLAEIWLIINQLKRLETGEIIGPVQLFSHLLSEIITENTSIDQHSIVQMAEEAGIMPIKSLKPTQENLSSILKQLDSASIVQMGSFLNIFVKKVPKYFIKLYKERPDGTLEKLQDISSTETNKSPQISVLLLGNGKYCVVHFEEDALDPSMRKKIKNSYESRSATERNKSRIPDLDDLVSGKMQTWFGSALLATKLTLGHEYVLHEEGVAPVDYSSTGVVQNNMQWGEGLQQFLEMKHQTKLSNMTLITNFLSNVGLFKKYKNQIFGITGTLGDQTELDMVKELYNGIDTCKIPSFWKRKLYELEGMVIPEKDEWIKTICDVVKNQVTSTVYRGPRAALIICETINFAEMFHKTLSDGISLNKLKLYVNNNLDNSTITDSEVQPGDVIIATNLAGRGTDLKVCKSVNEAGGLFVMQTFLPLNVRVEQQAFGRTARQGSPGSAQIIMCASHFSDTDKIMMDENASVNSLLGFGDNSRIERQNVFEEAVNQYLENHSSQSHDVMVVALTALLNTDSSIIEKTKDARNAGVKKRLSQTLEKDIPEIREKEDLFSAYLEFLDNIYEDHLYSDQRDVIVSSLHECWGLWLLMNFNQEKSNEKSTCVKEQLKRDLLIAKQKLLSKQSPSSMVYYYIRSGNHLRKQERLAESIEMYTKALKDGTSGEIIPLYNRALATIMKKDTGYLAQALADLAKAEKAIDSYKSLLAHILACVKSTRHAVTAEGDTLLSKQFQMKCMIVDQLKMNIQDAAMILKREESRGGNVRLLEKHTVFLAKDFLKRAIRRRDMSLPERLALTMMEDFIKRGEIKQDASLVERFALLHTEDNRKAAERRRQVDPVEILLFFLLKDSVHSCQKIMIELIMEYEHIRSLGLDSIFALDTMSFFMGIWSKIFG